MARSLVSSLNRRALAESVGYYARRPNRLPPANSPNRPHLALLHRHARAVRSEQPDALTFAFDGSDYFIAWAGERLCVVHSVSHHVMVAGGVSLDVGL